jgi:hypothetical protein
MTQKSMNRVAHTNTTRPHSTALLLSLALGAFVVYTGAALTFSPEAGEHLFGVNIGGPDNDKLFHVAAGVRELYVGLLFFLFVWQRAYRGLGLLLMTSAVLPLADFVLALTGPDGTLINALRHAPAIFVVPVLGWWVLSHASAKNNN